MQKSEREGVGQRDERNRIFLAPPDSLIPPLSHLSPFRLRDSVQFVFFARSTRSKKNTRKQRAVNILHNTEISCSKAILVAPSGTQFQWLKALRSGGDSNEQTGSRHHITDFRSRESGFQTIYLTQRIIQHHPQYILFLAFLQDSKAIFILLRSKTILWKDCSPLIFLFINADVIYRQTRKHKCASVKKGLIKAEWKNVLR